MISLMTEPAAGMTVEDLRGNPKRVRREATVRVILICCALVSVVVSALIIGTLFSEAWVFVRDLSRESGLASLIDKGARPGWYPREGRFDLRTVIQGTLLVAAVAMLVATPLGLGAAIYLSEYARPRARKWLKPLIEMLASIPSVVLGFFAIRFLGPSIVQPLFNTDAPKNLLVTGLAVGVLVTPLMASITEDALRSVPHSLREASYGIGARKSVTTIKVVLPAAVSGIVAAFILAVSRAIGETMIAALASGALGQAARTINPTDTGLTMTAAMAQVATGTDNVAGSGLAFQSLFFVGAVLFLITLVLNTIGDRFVQRFRARY
jgi:phosphate transport system permease protein